MLENKLSISDALKSGFQLWKKHFYKIMMVGLAVYLPTQLLIEVASVIFNNSPSADNPSNLSLSTNIYNIIKYIFGAIALMGILNFIIGQLENKEELTIKQILQAGLDNWGKYIGVAIMTGLKVLAYFILLIVPGIYKSVRYTFIDCIVATNTNIFKDERDESEELVKGNWWGVFGFLMLVFLLEIIIEVLFALPVYFIPESHFLSLLTGVVISLIETYFIVVRASLFVQLKQIKNESYDSIDSIAQPE